MAVWKRLVCHMSWITTQLALHRGLGEPSLYCNRVCLQSQSLRALDGDVPDVVKREEERRGGESYEMPVKAVWGRMVLGWWRDGGGDGPWDAGVSLR